MILEIANSKCMTEHAHGICKLVAAGSELRKLNSFNSAKNSREHKFCNCSVIIACKKSAYFISSE